MDDLATFKRKANQRSTHPLSPLTYMSEGVLQSTVMCMCVCNLALMMLVAFLSPTHLHNHTQPLDPRSLTSSSTHLQPYSSDPLTLTHSTHITHPCPTPPPTNPPPPQSHNSMEGWMQNEGAGYNPNEPIHEINEVEPSPHEGVDGGAEAESMGVDVSEWWVHHSGIDEDVEGVKRMAEASCRSPNGCKVEERGELLHALIALYVFSQVYYYHFHKAGGTTLCSMAKANGLNVCEGLFAPPSTQSHSSSICGCVLRSTSGQTA